MGTSSGIFGAVQGDSESAVTEKSRFEGTGNRLSQRSLSPKGIDRAGQPGLREQILFDLCKYNYTLHYPADSPGALIGITDPSVFMANTEALRGQGLGGLPLD